MIQGLRIATHDNPGRQNYDHDASIEHSCIVLHSGGRKNDGTRALRSAGNFAIQTRSILLDNRLHLPPTRQWMGDPRGQWERNTLFVNSTNFTGKTTFRGADENTQPYRQAAASKDYPNAKLSDV
jgi:hypothetical protein